MNFYFFKKPAFVNRPRKSYEFLNFRFEVHLEEWNDTRDVKYLLKLQVLWINSKRRTMVNRETLNCVVRVNGAALFKFGTSTQLSFLLLVQSTFWNRKFQTWTSHFFQELPPA